MKKIRFSDHAVQRMNERCYLFGLTLESFKKRVEETIHLANLSKTKYSPGQKVYYKYFNDNTSLFVICTDEFDLIRVSTIIIVRGRE